MVNSGKEFCTQRQYFSISWRVWLFSSGSVVAECVPLFFCRDIFVAKDGAGCCVGYGGAFIALDYAAVPRFAQRWCVFHEPISIQIESVCCNYRGEGEEAVFGCFFRTSGGGWEILRGGRLVLVGNQSKSMLEISGLGGCLMLFLNGFLFAKIVYRQRWGWVGWEVRAQKGETRCFLGDSCKPTSSAICGFK
jgi:hypothetical protein